MVYDFGETIRSEAMPCFLLFLVSCYLSSITPFCLFPSCLLALLLHSLGLMFAEMDSYEET